MKRIPNWQARLIAVVKDHSARPFEWGGKQGGSDCHMLAMDAVVALTGVDPYLDERGRYTTAIGAKRLFTARGFRWLDEAYAAVFPEVAPSFARRGDIGLLDCGGVDCAVVVVGAEAVGKSPDGVIRVPVRALKKAFKVG